MNEQTPDNIKTTIAYLSYGGLIPFIAATAGFYLLDEPLRTLALNLFVSYAAVILSFVGAVHWGFLLKSVLVKNLILLLTLSVLPGLIACIALLFEQQYALIIFLASYPLLLAYERITALNTLLPDWYRSMRVKLTCTVTLLILVVLIGKL